MIDFLDSTRGLLRSGLASVVQRIVAAERRRPQRPGSCVTYQGNPWGGHSAVAEV